MSRSLVVLCLLLSACSFLGFGCRERGASPLPGYPAPPPSISPPPPPVLKSGGVEKGTDPALIQIQQSLDNLAKAESYQLDIQLPRTTRGGGSGQLLYTKDRGILATLLVDGIRTELYFRGGSLYVKYATSSWNSVPPGEEHDSIEQMIRQAFFSDTTGANTLALIGSATVLKKEQDPSGCTQYNLQQTFYSPTTVTERFDICLSGGVPTYIRYIRPEGTSVLFYSRLNDPALLLTPPVE